MLQKCKEEISVAPCSKSLAIDAFWPFPESLSCEYLAWDTKESKPVKTFPEPPLSRLLLVYATKSSYYLPYSRYKSHFDDGAILMYIITTLI